MAAQRTAENAGGEQRVDIFLPESVGAGQAAGINDIDVLEATDYYRNRQPNANSGTRMLFSHGATNLAWDAFAFAETLLTQPMMVVIGDEPGGFGASGQIARWVVNALANDTWCSAGLQVGR